MAKDETRDSAILIAFGLMALSSGVVGTLIGVGIGWLLWH